jgi:Zn-dependent protease/CBS domain-containing protein
MNEQGVPIGRLFGIEIRVSLAWVLMLAIVTVLGVEQAAARAPTLHPLVHWTAGAVVAALFLVSVIVHELAHALVGRRRGVPVTSVALGFIGGLAPASVRAARPRDELAIAVSGPLLSAGVGVALLGGGIALLEIAPDVGLVADAMVVVGALNLTLAVISLLPALPVDGGRVVRALAWARTGDLDRASLVTAKVGRIVGWAAVGMGFVVAMAGYALEGVVGIALGWLLNTGAGTIESRVAMERLLRGVHVGDAMDRNPVAVGPNLTVDTFMDRFDGPDPVLALAVVEGDQVLGVVGRRRLTRLRRRRYGSTRVRDVMASPPAVPVLHPGDELWEAVELITTANLDAVAVADGGRLAGLVTRAGISAAARSAAGREAAAASTDNGPARPDADPGADPAVAAAPGAGLGSEPGAGPEAGADADPTAGGRRDQGSGR